MKETTKIAVLCLGAVIGIMLLCGIGIVTLDNLESNSSDNNTSGLSQLIPPANAETLKSGDIKYAIGQSDGSMKYYFERIDGTMVDITKSEYENSE